MAAGTELKGPTDDMAFETGIALLLGLAAPIVATTASWVMSKRTWRRRPAALTRVTIAGFAAKLVFFGAYVAVMIGVLSLRRVPFMASFTISFIVLHLVEAVALRRLLAAASE